MRNNCSGLWEWQSGWLGPSYPPWKTFTGIPAAKQLYHQRPFTPWILSHWILPPPLWQNPTEHSRQRQKDWTIASTHKPSSVFSLPKASSQPHISGRNDITNRSGSSLWGRDSASNRWVQSPSPSVSVIVSLCKTLLLPYLLVMVKGPGVPIEWHLDVSSCLRETVATM